MKKEKKIIRILMMLFGYFLLGFGVLKIGYSLFMYILGLGINVLSAITIGGGIISIGGVLCLIPKCIKKEIVYEVNGYEISDNSEYMRSQLYVVKENNNGDSFVEKKEEEKYSYVFDDEYRDDMNYDDVIIDDMSEFCDMNDFRSLGNVGYSRCKSKYRGRYLR